MHLYTHPRSPWCRKVDWAFAEMGIAHSPTTPLETTLVPAEGDAMKEAVRAMKERCGAHATLPTLVDGDFVLSESSAIVFYMADARGHNSAFLPKAPKERARIMQWDRIGDITLGANVLSPWLRNTTFLGAGTRDEAVLAKARTTFEATEARLAEALGAHTFLASDSFTFADLGPAHILAMLARLDGPRAKHPAVERWLSACLDRPAYVTLANRLA
jgi:glutathione S-transferase